MHDLAKKQSWIKVATVVSLGLVAASVAYAQVGDGPGAENRHTTVIQYDSFHKPGGYTIADYLSKWSNPYGPGEMGVRETRRFDNNVFSIDAAPFQTGYDFSVFDHIKYLAISNQSFTVPQDGSVMFSIDIAAETPGTVPGRVIVGTYGPPGSYPHGAPYSATVLQGQQAGATLHMIDFATGQLFDWFVSGNTAFTLIKRLPSSVTGSQIPVGRSKMYTQIIREVGITPGPHTVAIRYSRRNRSGGHAALRRIPRIAVAGSNEGAGSPRRAAAHARVT